MAVLSADNNGGRYNMVHRQTDDGIVLSVAMGKNLTPLVFRYDDYLGCTHETLLASDFYPHKRLMRGDCGWRREDDSDALLFSWQAMEKVSDGFSNGPDNVFTETYHEEANCAKDVQICGLKGHRTKFYRKDREYWTPDHTLQADVEETPFGFNQWNPISCAPKKPNKCGLINFKEKC